MKTIFLYSVVITCLISPNNLYSQDFVELDYEILKLDEYSTLLNIDTLKQSDLSEEDLYRINALSKKCIEDWNESVPIKLADGEFHKRQLNEYFVQLIPTISKTGNKYIWVNFVKKGIFNERLHKLYISTSGNTYNCWINLNEQKIIDRTK